METVLVNVIAKSRREVLAGREYLVCPATILTENVLTGSQGALFYPADEIARNPEAWNGMPLLHGHPVENGNHISGRSPEVWNKSYLGYFFNAHIEANTLQGETWFDIAAVRNLDSRLLKRLQSGQPIELSTGLHTRNEPRHGVFNNKPFEAIARDYRPDHIAILPDAQGACSIKDGCGVLVNEDDCDGLINAFNPDQPRDEGGRWGIIGKVMSSLFSKKGEAPAEAKNAPEQNNTIRVTADEKRYHEQEFSVGDKKYRVTATSDDGNHWRIGFVNVKGGSETAKLTGEAGSSAIKVMANVGKAVLDFVRDKKPSSFEFSAITTEPSRVRLYDRLAKKSEEHGYRLARTEEDNPQRVRYAFTRQANADNSHQVANVDELESWLIMDGEGKSRSILVNEERKSLWRKLGELLGVINADLPTPTEEQKRLGADCAKQKAMGHNPPSWAVDEALWEKAKEAAAKSGHEEDWPYVVAIYEQMGGKIEGVPTANMGPNEPSHDDLREQLESLIKERFGGLMKAGMPGMSMMGGGMMGGEEEHDCIEAVYDKEVVFEMGDKYWSISYTTDLRTGAVTLDSGPPTEVNRVTTYKPVTNADSAAEDATDNAMDPDMQQCMDDCEGDRNCIDDCKEMMMNENERKAIIDHLATNCDCWKGDKEGLAKLSDQRLAALKQHSDSQTANTIPQSFEDGDRVFTFNATSKTWEGKAKEKPVLPDPAIRLTAEEREDLAFARQERTRQKQEMVDRLTANIADENAKRAAATVYASMKPEQLQPLLNALPPAPVQQPNYPSYLGAAGGGLAANAKDDSNNILPEISINFEDMASPKLRRKQA